MTKTWEMMSKASHSWEGHNYYTRNCKGPSYQLGMFLWTEIMSPTLSPDYKQGWCRREKWPRSKQRTSDVCMVWNLRKVFVRGYLMQHHIKIKGKRLEKMKAFLHTGGGWLVKIQCHIPMPQPVCPATFFAILSPTLFVIAMLSS